MNPFAELTRMYTIIQVAIAISVVLIVYFRPKTFWPLVMIGALVGQGPRFISYQLYDELILGCALSGAFARIALLGIKSKVRVYPTQQRAIFFIWICYMIVESIIGIIYNDDLRIIRWTLFYCLLFALSIVTYHYDEEFPFPTLKQLIGVVLITALIYSAGYIAVGMIYDSLMERVGRYDSQFKTEGFVWAGTATAVFPYILAVPIAVIAVTSRSTSIIYKIFAWVIIVVTMYLANYYQSRMCWFILATCIGGAILRFKPWHVIVGVISFVIVWQSYGYKLNQTGEFFSELVEGAQTLWLEGEGGGDTSRRLQFQAGFHRVSDGPKVFLFGDGMHSHRYTLIPHLERLYSINLKESMMGTPTGDLDETHEDNYGSLSIVRTTGFTALLVDTGIVGMLIFAANFIVVGLILLKRRCRYTLLLLGVLNLSFWWLFVNNVVDVLVLYLFFMPHGILERVAELLSDYDDLNRCEQVQESVMYKV